MKRRGFLFSFSSLILANGVVNSSSDDDKYSDETPITKRLIYGRFDGKIWVSITLNERTLHKYVVTLRVNHGENEDDLAMKVVEKDSKYVCFYTNINEDVEINDIYLTYENYYE